MEKVLSVLWMLCSAYVDCARVCVCVCVCVCVYVRAMRTSFEW
jgi:hypothetical protein